MDMLNSICELIDSDRIAQRIGECVQRIVRLMILLGASVER